MTKENALAVAESLRDYENPLGRTQIEYALLALADCLDAPVAGDARELAADIVDDVTTEIQGAIGRTTAKIERFVAERERKAREEEREACAERAEIFYRQDCGGCGEFETIHEGCIGAIESGNTVLTKHAYGCSHIKELRAAIKEAGNGKV